jgi:hypothetical protein
MSGTELRAGLAAEVTTLLRYELTTDPFPLEASPASGSPELATLKVVGSNPDPANPVTIRSVSITLPVGPEAAQLTNSAPDGPVAPDDWTLKETKPGEGMVQYVFKPNAGKGQIAGQGLAFIFNNIQPNTQPGVAAITVAEGTEDGGSQQLLVTKFPNDWGEVNFIVDPPIIPYNGSTALKWTGPAGATYSIMYYTPRTGIVNIPSAGEQPLANRGRYPPQNGKPLQLVQNTTFYLTVVGLYHGKSYTAQKALPVTVTAMPPEITCFKSEPATAYGYTIAKEGRDTIPEVEVKLSWTTEHAKECELTGVPQLLATNTCLPQKITKPKTFVLKAYGSVEPAATQSLDVNFRSVLRISGQLSHPKPTRYEFSYHYELLVPPNSDVQLELNMSGKAYQMQRTSNRTGADQNLSLTGGSTYDNWDDNGTVVITCSGATSYRIVCPLVSVVGTAPR